MFTSRPELLDKEETTADHGLSHREEIEKLDKDKANTDPHHGGLFGGLFNPKPPSLKPIVDGDDGVARCPMCSWELEDDHTCGGCGWLYRSDSDESDLSESDLSMTDEYDSALEDDDIEEDRREEPGALAASILGPYGGPLTYGFPPAVMGPSWGHMRVPFPFSHHHFPPPRPMGAIPLDEEDDYDEEEDDDYDDLDSFIDDGDEQNGHGHVQGADFDSQSDHSTVVNGARSVNPPSSRAPPAHPYHPHYAWAPPPRVLTDDEDEDEESEPAEYLGNYANATAWAPRTFGTSASHSSSVSASEEEGGEEDGEDASDDEEDSDRPQAGRSRPHFYQPSSIIPDSDDESVPDNSSSPPRPMRSSRAAGLSAGNAITIDDSDDDQPVGPIRRTAQRRQARFSPY